MSHYFFTCILRLIQLVPIHVFSWLLVLLVSTLLAYSLLWICIMGRERELRMSHQAASSLHSSISGALSIFRDSLQLDNLYVTAQSSSLSSFPLPRVSSTPSCVRASNSLSSTSSTRPSASSQQLRLQGFPRTVPPQFPSSPTVRASADNIPASRRSWPVSTVDGEDGYPRSSPSRIRFFSPCVDFLARRSLSSLSQKRRRENAERMPRSFSHVSLSCVETAEGVATRAGQAPYIPRSHPLSSCVCHYSPSSCLTPAVSPDSSKRPVRLREEEIQPNTSPDTRLNEPLGECRLPSWPFHEGEMIIQPRVQPGITKEHVSGRSGPGCFPPSVTTRYRSKLPSSPSSPPLAVAVVSPRRHHAESGGSLPLPDCPPFCSPPPPCSLSVCFRPVMGDDEVQDCLLHSCSSPPMFTVSAVHASASFSQSGGEEDDDLGEEDGFHFVLACEDDEEEDASSSSLGAFHAGDDGGTHISTSDDSRAQMSDASCFSGSSSSFRATTTPSASTTYSSVLPASLATAGQASEKPSPFSYVGGQGTEHVSACIKAGDDPSFLLTGKPSEENLLTAESLQTSGGTASIGPRETVSMLHGSSVIAPPVGAVRTDLIGASKQLNEIHPSTSSSAITPGSQRMISALLPNTFEKGAGERASGESSSLQYQTEVRRDVSFDPTAGSEGLPTSYEKTGLEQGNREDPQLAYQRQMVYRQSGDVGGLSSHQESRKQSDTVAGSTVLSPQYTRSPPAPPGAQTPQQQHRFPQQHNIHPDASSSPSVSSSSQKPGDVSSQDQQDGGRQGKALSSLPTPGQQHLANPSLSRDQHQQSSHLSSLGVGALPSAVDVGQKQKHAPVSLQPSSEDLQTEPQRHHHQNIHFPSLSGQVVVCASSQAFSPHPSRAEYLSQPQPASSFSATPKQQEPRGDSLGAASTSSHVSSGLQAGAHREQGQQAAAANTKNLMTSNLTHHHGKHQQQPGGQLPAETALSQAGLTEPLSSFSTQVDRSQTQSQQPHQQTYLLEHGSSLKQGVGSTQQQQPPPPVVQDDKTLQRCATFQEKHSHQTSSSNEKRLSQQVEGSQVHQKQQVSSGGGVSSAVPPSPSRQSNSDSKEANNFLTNHTLSSSFSLQTSAKQHPSLPSQLAPLLGVLTHATQGLAFEGQLSSQATKSTQPSPSSSAGMGAGTGVVSQQQQAQTRALFEKSNQGKAPPQLSSLSPPPCDISGSTPPINSPSVQTPLNVSRQASVVAPSPSQMSHDSSRLKSSPSLIPAMNRLSAAPSPAGIGGGKLVEAALSKGMKPKTGSHVSRTTAGALSNLNTSSLRAAAKLHAGRGETNLTGSLASFHGIGSRPLGKQYSTVGGSSSPKDSLHLQQQQAGPTKGTLPFDEGGKGLSLLSPVTQFLTPEEAAVAAAAASVSMSEPSLFVETPSTIEAALPPVEWLPSISHLLNIFSYVKDPVLEDSLRSQEKGTSSRDGEHSSQPHQTTQRTIPLPSSPPVPPSPSSNSGGPIPSDLSAVSSSCLLTFPPPLYSLLYPPQPPVHFGPTIRSPLTPEQFLMGAIDPGLLDEGHNNKEDDCASCSSSSSDAVDSTSAGDGQEDLRCIHELLQPAGARVALASRQRQLGMLLSESFCKDSSREMTSSLPSRHSLLSPLTADKSGKITKSGALGKTSNYPLIPPGHRLSVVRLDIRKACGSASIVEELLRKLAADDAKLGESEKKKAETQIKEEEEEGGGGLNSSVDEGGGTAAVAVPSTSSSATESQDPEQGAGKNLSSSKSSAEDHPMTNNSAVPGASGESVGPGATGGSVPLDTSATNASRPSTPSSQQEGGISSGSVGGGSGNGDTISENSPAPSPDTAQTSDSAFSSSVSKPSRRPHGPLLPPPEEILWDTLDWLEGVEALCVAWLSDCGLPACIPLLQKPSSLPSSFPFLSYRQKKTRSGAGRLNSEKEMRDSGNQNESIASTPTCPDTAKTEEIPPNSPTSFSTQGGEVGDPAGEQSSLSRSSKSPSIPVLCRSGLQLPEKKNGEISSGEWVLALKDLLVADVRRQLGRAAVREVDFACLVQMAETLKEEEGTVEAQQRQQQAALGGVLRAPLPSFMKTGMSPNEHGKIFASSTHGQMFKSAASAFTPSSGASLGGVTVGMKERGEGIMGRGLDDGNRMCKSGLTLESQASLPSPNSTRNGLTTLLPSSRITPSPPFTPATTQTPTAAASRHAPFLTSGSHGTTAGGVGHNTMMRGESCFGDFSGMHGGGGGSRTPSASTAGSYEDRSSLWSLHRTTPETSVTSIDRSGGSDLSSLTSSLPSSSPTREEGGFLDSVSGGREKKTVGSLAATVKAQSGFVHANPFGSSPSRSHLPSPVTNSSGYLSSSSPGSVSCFSPGPLFNALTCAILEVDVYDPDTQVRIDDRVYWRLTADDHLVLQYCQQLAADLDLPPAVVARYRVALHKAVERQKISLLFDYKPQLRMFHTRRGLRLPPGFLLEDGSAASGGGATGTATGQPQGSPATTTTSSGPLGQSNNVTQERPSNASVTSGGERMLSASSAGATAPAVAAADRGIGRGYWGGRKRGSSLDDWAGEEGLVLYESKRSSTSPSSSLLFPWCTEVVQSVRRTCPTKRRPLFLQSKRPSSSLLASSLSSSSLSEGVTFSPSLSLGSCSAEPFLSFSLSQSFVRRRMRDTKEDSSSLLQKVEGVELLGRTRLGGLFSDSDVGGDEKEETKNAEVKKKLLELEQTRQRDLLNQLHAGTLPEFGPLILRGPDAATWPGRKLGQKRRRR
ncbi:hypothetical protein CSUI_002686 [Cystoisospora suis]|uniref:Transmembrane protein n=1 Tax=Cystoisospora suis TaxID=483139 RepID=A0A2C6L888_9APIC|nr:hypothetical protein CSUI_002686 [Cystoisospora suis]